MIINLFQNFYTQVSYRKTMPADVNNLILSVVLYAN
jgi:hypothetical protein